jgi:hypothetical protein
MEFVLKFKTNFFSRWQLFHQVFELVKLVDIGQIKPSFEVGLDTFNSNCECSVIYHVFIYAGLVSVCVNLDFC